MQCPDENTLGELARGELPAQERAQVEAHLDACDACNEVVAELAKIFRSAFPEDEGAPERSSDEFDGSGPIDDIDATVSERPLLPHERPLSQGEHLGRYVVLQAVGAGAMGVVYAAYDPQLDRKVALKVLKPMVGESYGDSQSDRSKRLLREAQALARLSHPGVIAVHDVGTVDERVFLAMEFVEGGTLTEWLRAEPRSWRQVLEVFSQAGEGLAAAHDAGLVHRDFKPDNVLIRADGRAAVTDFGLARPAASSGDNGRTQERSMVSAVVADSLGGSSASASGGSALSATLTRTGALVGTPAYMAPEQLDGQRGGHLSDQFGFCVALYEGLYGERPFKARSLTGLIAAVFEGRIPPPPRGREVPRWLRRAVVTGLRTEPRQRHASMRALLTALRPRRLGSWRGVVAMGAIGLVTGASAIALGGAATQQPVAYCDDVAAKLDGVWDDDRRAAVRDSFAATSLPFAPDIADRVTAKLDAYAERWVEMQTNTCRQGFDGSEPEAVISARSMCLTRRRRTLGAIAEVLAEADGSAVMRAIDAVETLPDLEICAETLGDGLAPIPQASRDTVEDVRALIDQTVGLHALGRVADGLETSTEAVALAETVDYDPVLAEAVAEHGVALSHSGKSQEAEAALHRALTLAVATQHQQMIARSAAGLAWVHSTGTAQPLVIKRWARLGLAALDALGQPNPNLRADILSSLAGAQRNAGELTRSLETGAECLEIREQRWGVDHYSVVEPLSEMGMTLARLGRRAESVEHLQRARRVLLETYGPTHPHYAAILQNLGTTHFVHGNYADGLELYEEARQIIVEQLGKTHPSAGVLAYNVATALTFMERYDDALPFAHKAQAIEQDTYGADSPGAATGWALEGEIHLRAGNYDKAVETIGRALKISEKSTPTDHPRDANYRSQYGIALLLSGDINGARAQLDKALEFQRSEYGESSVQVAETSGRLAMVYLQLGELAQARAFIDTSVEQYPKVDPDAHQHAEALFRRARIKQAQGEHESALADARNAETIYADLDQQPKRLATVRRWIDQASAPAVP